jgi:acetoin utilization protein AcuB
MLMPPVSRYMTPNPYAIGSRDTLAEARSMMQEHRIRHLPVVDEDRLVGIVSDRDLASCVTDDRVADAMTSDVATVNENAPLDEVVNLMDAGKFGSVVVTGKHGIEGIFTVTDAMRAFGEFLRRADAAER